MVAGIGPAGVAYLLTVASSNMRFNFAFQKWKQVAVVICMMDCVFVVQVSDTARTGTEEPTAAQQAGRVDGTSKLTYYNMRPMRQD